MQYTIADSAQADSTALLCFALLYFGCYVFCNAGDDGDGDENAIRGSSARDNYCSTSLVHVRMFYMFVAMKITAILIVLKMMINTMIATPYHVPAPKATIAARHLCTWEQRRQCTSCSVGRCIKRL